MPLIPESSYRPPAWLRGGHAQTIYPAIFRRFRHATRRAERIELPDGDFLDLEWAGEGSEKLAILSHGLEADTATGYIQGMAAALIARGWDVLAWNFRGCGSEPNRLLRMYHSGATEDLHAVVDHALAWDAAGHPHLAYGGDQLYHAWHDGTRWQTEIVDPMSSVGIVAALDIDSQDRVHISYFDGSATTLKYARRDGTR